MLNWQCFSHKKKKKRDGDGRGEGAEEEEEEKKKKKLPRKSGLGLYKELVQKEMFKGEKPTFHTHSQTLPSPIHPPSPLPAVVFVNLLPLLL